MRAPECTIEHGAVVFQTLREGIELARSRTYKEGRSDTSDDERDNDDPKYDDAVFHGGMIQYNPCYEHPLRRSREGAAYRGRRPLLSPQSCPAGAYRAYGRVDLDLGPSFCRRLCNWQSARCIPYWYVSCRWRRDLDGIRRSTLGYRRTHRTRAPVCSRWHCRAHALRRGLFAPASFPHIDPRCSPLPCILGRGPRARLDRLHPV